MKPAAPQPDDGADSAATPEPAAVQRLLAAAGAVLHARADQMLTRVEWRELRDAVVACGGLQAEVAPDLDDRQEVADG